MFSVYMIANNYAGLVAFWMNAMLTNRAGDGGFRTLSPLQL